MFLLPHSFSHTQHPPFCVGHKITEEQKDSLPLATRERGVDVGVCILVESSDGRILVTRRAPHMRTFPGVWVPPGGHVEEGENLVEAGVREMMEETGLELNSLVKMRKQKSVQKKEEEEEEDKRLKMEEEEESREQKKKNKAEEGREVKMGEKGRGMIKNDKHRHNNNNSNNNKNNKDGKTTDEDDEEWWNGTETNKTRVINGKTESCKRQEEREQHERRGESRTRQQHKHENGTRDPQKYIRNGRKNSEPHSKCFNNYDDTETRNERKWNEEDRTNVDYNQHMMNDNTSNNNYNNHYQQQQQQQHNSRSNTSTCEEANNNNRQPLNNNNSSHYQPQQQQTTTNTNIYYIDEMVTGQEVKDKCRILGLWESFYPPVLYCGLPKRHHLVVYFHLKLKLSSTDLQQFIKLNYSEVDACVWLTRELAEVVVNGYRYSTLHLYTPCPSLDLLQVPITLVDDEGFHIPAFLDPKALREEMPEPDREVERMSTGTRYALQLWLQNLAAKDKKKYKHAKNTPMLSINIRGQDRSQTIETPHRIVQVRRGQDRSQSIETPHRIGQVSRGQLTGHLRRGVTSGRVAVGGRVRGGHHQHQLRTGQVAGRPMRKEEIRLQTNAHSSVQIPVDSQQDTNVTYS
ncbi:hypothetical protein Pmani_004241 [Petrolisthes manimaculis]|uniref:Nudix hydrolase domain-containing protein n=1 Tax=Petrolisthes manimaculis TaxID=1843537 RepID=A0AAE1UNE6_9EUCA|nr:hypothetical protein Pmani_004241 [Petrolisthes manimaculis]